MRQQFPLITTLLCLALASAGCTTLPVRHAVNQWFGQRSSRTSKRPYARATGELALSHLQLKGSHNSYHRAPRFALSPSWRYSHAPLQQQLEQQGVRQIELDVRYVRGEIVVGHLPVVDGRTSCRTLNTCLAELKQWSKKNPAHLPVFVFIEPKEHVAPSHLQGRLDAVDGVIRHTFSREHLLTPEDVVGDAVSVSEALQTTGWPSVESLRGRIAFVLFGGHQHPQAYTRGRPRLEGRTMFAATSPDDPAAGVLLYDNPVKQAADIRRAVERGLLVRTRADAMLVRDRGRRDAALASGAHFVATDFLENRYHWLDLDHHSPVRCNPVTAPERCTSGSIAGIEQLLWAGLKPTTM